MPKPHKQPIFYDHAHDTDGQEVDVQSPQITQSKKQLLAGAGDAFSTGDKIAEDNEKTVLELRAKVGD